MNTAGSFSRVFYIPASGQHDFSRDEQNLFVNTLYGQVTEEDESGVVCEITREVWSQTAFEIPFINGNKGYIDVMVPYQDIFRFRQTDSHTGYLCVAFNVVVSNPDTNKMIQVFQSVGDDFAVGCFHAVPKDLIYRVVQVTPPEDKKLVNRSIPFGLSGFRGDLPKGPYLRGRQRKDRSLINSKLKLKCRRLNAISSFPMCKIAPDCINNAALCDVYNALNLPLDWVQSLLVTSALGLQQLCKTHMTPIMRSVLTQYAQCGCSLCALTCGSMCTHPYRNRGFDRN